MRYLLAALYATLALAAWKCPPRGRNPVPT